MSNRSLIEFNHDYCPTTDEECLMLGRALQQYMRNAEIGFLPAGVIRKHYRHHSDPDPMLEAVKLRVRIDDLRDAIAAINTKTEAALKL